MALEWIAAAVGSPSGPAVLVWYEPATDLVIDIRITDASFRDAAELFTHATQEPKAGEPRRPTRVRVADETLAAVLRTVPGLEVVVGDISDAREMLEALGAHISQLDLVPEVAPHVWERFFRAAAALYRARPWKAIPSDAWLEVDCDALAITGGALTVVGQHGSSHGILLCHSAADAAAWLAAGERRERGDAAAFPHEFFMLGYDDHRDVDPEDLAEISRRGWEVAAFAAYPVLSVLDETATSRLPTNAEVTGVTSIIEALAAFVADEPDLADAWDGDPVEWQGDLEGARVRLAAPLAVHEPADDSVMERLAEVLVEFADVYHSASFATITADQLVALLLETIPAQLAVEPAEAPMILAATRALLARHPRPEPLVAMLGPIFEQRLASELGNPAIFTPGKQLVMAGIAAGYDMSSEEGVEEFVEAFARDHLARAAKPTRGSTKRSARATKKRPAAAKRKPARAPAKKPARAAKANAKAKAKARVKVRPKAKAGPNAKASPKAGPNAKASPKATAKPKRR